MSLSLSLSLSRQFAFNIIFIFNRDVSRHLCNYFNYTMSRRAIHIGILFSEDFIVTTYRSSSNDNDKTHFLSFPVDSILLPPSNFEHCAIIIIPWTSFFQPGIDRIINKHHANYSATVLLIFSSHLYAVIHSRSPTVTINHSTQVHFCTFISVSAHFLDYDTHIYL